MFNAAIFERMKANNRGPPTRLQTRWQLGEQLVKRFQLIIDGYAQRLKGARGRMQKRATSFGSGHTAAHQISKFGGCRQGIQSPALDDCPGNAAAATLFAEFEYQVCQVPFRQATQQACRRLAVRSIESHVQRSVRLKTQAALCILQLIRTETQVGEHAVYPVDFELVQSLS